MVCGYVIARDEEGPCQTCGYPYAPSGGRHYGREGAAMTVKPSIAHPYLGPPTEVCGHPQESHYSAYGFLDNCEDCFKSHGSYAHDFVASPEGQSNE